MSAISQPRILTYVAGGTIVKGHAVKFGADYKTVVEVTATTDKSIGVAQIAGSSGDSIEVAVNGGGAKGAAKTTIATGDLLGHNADGTLQKANAANDRVIGVAMQDAVAADIFYLEVALGMATQAQS